MGAATTVAAVAVSVAVRAAFCRGLFLEVWATAAVLHPAAGAEVPAVAATVGADLAAAVTSAAAARAATGNFTIISYQSSVNKKLITDN